MSSTSGFESDIAGSLRVDDGRGVVRMEVRLAAGVDDVWSALTDPSRLAEWYGEITGDLRLGGEYRAHLHASGWEGSGRIEVCEPRQRLAATGAEDGDEVPGVTEVTLTADGEHTLMVCEERGMPVELVAAYGVGVQIHVEDLVAHLAGRGRVDVEARWGDLQPIYAALAAAIR